MNVGLQPINVTAAWAVDADIQGDWEQAAIYYLQNYEERWSTWMPSDEAEKVRDALANIS
jgi:glycine betaine/proline transport system substrate-binding protein